jgi:hypothetical protein
MAECSFLIGGEVCQACGTATKSLMAGGELRRMHFSRHQPVPGGLLHILQQHTDEFCKTRRLTVMLALRDAGALSCDPA